MKRYDKWSVFFSKIYSYTSNRLEIIFFKIVSFFVPFTSWDENVPKSVFIFPVLPANSS